jgi:hypothetical protein
LADDEFPGSQGIQLWSMTNNGAVDPSQFNQPGALVVQVGGDLSLYPVAVAVDNSGNIYTTQYRLNSGDPAARVMEFPPYDGTNAGFFATWTAGGGVDTYRGIDDISLDSYSSPKYLALAQTAGTGTLGSFNPNLADCSVIIANAADGSYVTNLVVPTDASLPSYKAADWDAVGNVYAATATLQLWRVFSPPGANQATTPAIASIQVGAAATAPHITSITYNSTSVTINFTGAPTDAAANFTLQSSSAVTGPYGNVLTAIATQNSPGAFTFTTVPNGTTQFYRISR